MKRHQVWLVALAASACDLEPSVGPLINESCDDSDSEPDVQVSFQADIVPLIRGATQDPGCRCHLPEDSNRIGIDASGLDLGSYSALREGGNNSRTDIVVPGSPCQSVLWQKVSPGPPFGGRMPFDAPPFLSEQARILIADWIAEGALDN